MKLRERRRERKELRERIYRPSSKAERVTRRRESLQAAATVLLCILLLAVLAAAIVIYRIRTPQGDPTDTPTDTAPPRYTVIIDPGHGGTDTGSAVNDETSEADYTMILANELRERLTAADCRVILTREADLDTFLSEEDRLAALKGSEAQCMISLHTCQEPGVYYSLLSDTTHLSSILASHLGNPIPESKYTITRPESIPCVRINCDESTEAALLSERITDYLTKYHP